MLSRLASVLDGVVTGFMALAALGRGVAPLLFELPSHAERGFDAAGWLIIALFALEYIAHFAVAADRRRFALDPWRMLDLANASCRPPRAACGACAACSIRSPADGVRYRG